ncbi:C2 calcium-dependent membrane targeting [Corchorus olitorius]|uniref:C2 calcium-dependent membrane targeting n=1 Tax=Corchorus olitorius TaxID=93759 RepID=A0A1R3FVN0_9ROSI|nr:C2 calcium-dependent membrane targeting [Corchorus olitorius]
MQKPPQAVDFALKETSPNIGAGQVEGDKLSCTYDLVEQMQYLYVRVVKAKDLPGKDVTGGCDPYVENSSLCVGSGSEGQGCCCR